MKNFIILLFLVVAMTAGFSQTTLRKIMPGSYSIGSGALPDPATATLQLNGVTSGFLLNRLTTTERDAIVTMVAGLEIYNTTLGKLQVWDGSAWITSGLFSTFGTGTDNHVMRWDGTGFPSAQDSLVIIDDLGVVSGVTQLSVDNIDIDGNTLSSTDVNGPITLAPNGVGVIDAQNAMTTVGITTTGINAITGSLTVDNLDVNGNTISSTDVNGPINLAPNGTGVVNISGLTNSRPMKLDASGNVSSSLIDLADRTNDLTGVNPIAGGGTNSGAALVNNFVMESVAGAIVESTTTSTELTYLDATSSIQTQLDAKEDTITILPASKGGTGIDGSTAANGSLLIGNGTGYTASTLTGTADQVVVTNGIGTSTLSLPQSINTTSSPSFTGLSVTGLTQHSIPFIGASGALSQNNNQLVWDDSITKLRLGNGAFSSDILTVNGSGTFSANVDAVGINGNTLSITSTTNGSIPYPAMTEAQRDLVALTPPSGTGVYNTTTEKINIYDVTAAAWVEVGSGGGGGSLLNLIVDPSFEAGVTEGTCTTCTASSETTNVELTSLNTKSLEMAFSASVGDYTDTTTTNSQYTGVTGLVSARIKTDQEDVWLCSIVDSAESHCVEINSDGVWDVYKINSTMSSTNFGIKIKASTAITGSVYVDEVFAGSKELEVVATQGKTQTVSHSSAHSTLLSLTTDIRFAIGNISSDIEGCLDVVDDAGNTQTKFVANESCNVNVFASLASDLINERIFIKLNGTTTIGSSSEAQRNNGFVTFGGIPLHLNSGDYFTIYANGTIDNGGSIADFKISATPQQNKAVIVSVDDDSMTDGTKETIDITGVTTDPTKGTTSYDGVTWAKDGQYLVANYTYIQTAAGTNGSGAHLFALPDGLVADGTLVNHSTTLGIASPSTKIGEGSVSDITNDLLYNVDLRMYNSTHFAAYAIGGQVGGSGAGHSNTGSDVGSSGAGLITATISYRFKIRVPIVGWSSRPTALATVQVEEMKTEGYTIPWSSNLWDAATDTDEWDWSLASPAFTTSSYISVTDVSGQTRISNTYGEKLEVHARISGGVDSGGYVAVWNSSGVQIDIIQGTGTGLAVGSSGVDIVLAAGDYIYFRNTDPEASRQGTMTLTVAPANIEVFLGNVNLTSYVSTPSSTKPVHYSATVTPTSGAACTVSNEKGSWIDSTTPTAVGDCTLNFTAFSDTPNCTLTTGTYVGALTEGFNRRIVSESSTTLRFYHQYQSSNAAGWGGTAVSVKIDCHGVQ